MTRTVPEYTCVIDLETTGSDENSGIASIIEVGYVLVKTKTLEEVGHGNIVANPCAPAAFRTFINEYDVPETLSIEEAFAALEQRMAPVVLEMHTKNGLWEDCKATDVNMHNVDAWLAQRLSWHSGLQEGKKEIALAGSGVGHFDSRWIRKFLPNSAKHFTYWTYDVGVLRRFFREICEVPVDSDPEGLSSGEQKTHRALDDARAHLHEMRVFRDWIVERQFLSNN